MPKVSEIFQCSPDSSTDVEKRLHDHCKHLLKGNLFVGTFKEKRFVDSLNSYRDVIKIADNEDDLIANLLTVKKRCVEFYGDQVWTGITTPATIGAPIGYNLWVELDEEVFGTYWYKIRNILFCDNEICLKLRIVRPYQKIENISSSEDSTVKTEEIIENSKKILNDTAHAFLLQLQQLLTFNNIKESTVFLFVMFATILTFSVNSIQFLLEYMLKLLQEIRKLIVTVTPIIQTFMNCSTQFVNGLLATIAFLLKGKAPATAATTTTPAQITQYAYRQPDERFIRARGLPSPEFTYYGQRHFQAYPQSSVRITPLD